MPSIGNFVSKIHSGIFGASSSKTLLGPPDKINPFIFLLSKKALSISGETRSQKTFISRNLLDINLVYCEP